MAIADAASDKKACDIVIIDMRKIPTVCDYFVIASGSSTTQVKAIADNIIRKLKEKGTRPYHTEGEADALWALLDYGDVVGHVFIDQMRRFYDLERLWGDAPQAGYIQARKALKVRRARAATKKKRRRRARS